MNPDYPCSGICTAIRINELNPILSTQRNLESNILNEEKIENDGV